MLCIIGFPFFILWFFIHQILQIRVNKGFYIDVQRVPLFEAMDYFVRMRVLNNTPYFLFFTFPLLCIAALFGTAYGFTEYSAGWIVCLCLNALWMFIGFVVISDRFERPRDPKQMAIACGCFIPSFLGIVIGLNLLAICCLPLYLMKVMHSLLPWCVGKEVPSFDDDRNDTSKDSDDDMEETPNHNNGDGNNNSNGTGRFHEAGDSGDSINNQQNSYEPERAQMVVKRDTIDEEL